MMKRIFSVLLTALLLLGATACGQKEEDVPAEESAPTWQEQYDLGLRYLSEGKYEEAILAFTAAIEIDEKQVEPYRKLAETYLAVDDIAHAIEYLERGLSITGDNSLKEQLDALKASTDPDDENSDAEVQGPLSWEAANQLAIKAYESARLIKAGDQYSFEITLPKLPAGYTWDVAAGVTLPDIRLGLSRNGVPYFCEGGTHLTEVLTYHGDENDLDGDLLAGIDLFLHDSLPGELRDSRGQYAYALTYVMERNSDVFYTGESDGNSQIFACNNDDMTVPPAYLTFNNPDIFSGFVTG